MRNERTLAPAGPGSSPKKGGDAGEAEQRTTDEESGRSVLTSARFTFLLNFHRGIRIKRQITASGVDGK
jgi:hypothetical protein